MAAPGEVTQLLYRARDGDPAAMDELVPLIYDDLRGMARHQLRSSDLEFTPTALVHESYIKLVGSQKLDWNDRKHFMAAAARAMRHVIVDEARRVDATKRGGDRRRVTLDLSRLESNESASAARATEVLALEEALTMLEGRSPRLARIVELRFFSDLPVPQVAEVLEVSERTVKRDWRSARAMLLSLLA